MEKISIILKCEEVKKVKSQLYFSLDCEIDFLKMNIEDDKIIIKGYAYNIENVQYIIERFNNVEILKFSTEVEKPKGWHVFNNCIDSGKIAIKFSKNEIKVVWVNDWVDYFDRVVRMFDRVSKSKKTVVATKIHQTTNWLDVRDNIIEILEFLDNEELEDFEDDYLDNGDCRIENPLYEFWDNFNQY